MTAATLKEPATLGSEPINEVKDTNIEAEAHLPLLSKDIIREILSVEVRYKDDKEKEACKRLVNELSTEDQEHAACSSYAYWLVQNTVDDYNDVDSIELRSDEMRMRMAMREAQRHWVGEHRKYDKALNSLKKAIRHRKEYNIDALRTCFPCNRHRNFRFKNVSNMEEFNELRHKYYKQVMTDLPMQHMLTRGSDESNRAVVLKMVRTSPEEDTDKDAYIITQLYLAERSFAATEYLSRGKEDKIVLFFDFQNYNRDNAPPMSVMRIIVKLLQNMYNERLHVMVVIEPPFWMKALAYVMPLLVSKDTQTKMKMAYGSGREALIQQYITEDNAMPFLLRNGKLSSQYSIEHYVNNVPYHCLYDYDA